ncbi:hypothetical protein ASC78_22955 [Variovorax sp. Root318D1]|uniref:hypothetical protein n=1 Tax=Variovorax sp. Root318D1 TaxID=1736513 RepID=UPI000700368D|nr:hypothetical protein [Variovorax sp. Root318D1]KQU89130.1 hypothetical protein ASC78_22955 [Variovorax sp. Root318D1]
MRRIIQAPEGMEPETPGLPSLPMDESIWEDGYSLVIDELKQGALQKFWKHYYGASAEMVLSGDDLAALRKDIMAVVPGCADKPAVAGFLLDLARMCSRAHRQKHSLHVIAD